MTPDELEREARKVLEPLRYSPVGISSSKEVEAGRAEMVPHLARLIERVPTERAERLAQRRRRRTLLWSSGGALALAAGFTLWVGTSFGDASEATTNAQLELVSGQMSQKGTPLHAGVRYAIDSLGRLSTPSGIGAKFVTDTGVKVDFAADSTADLSFSDRWQRLALNRGKVELSVPKLKPGTSLSVATPDAVVTVHGTRFSVELVGGHTCVRVREGIVSVARGDERERLLAGDSSGCASSELATSAEHALPRVEALPDGELDKSSESRADRTASLPKAKASGTLLQENELFRGALAAEQSGDFDRAERLTRKLLTRYPSSVMAPDGRRILARVRAKKESSKPNQP